MRSYRKGSDCQFNGASNQYVRIGKSFLEFDYCNNRLRFVLVTCKQFFSLKRCGVDYTARNSTDLQILDFATLLQIVNKVKE